MNNNRPPDLNYELVKLLENLKKMKSAVGSIILLFIVVIATVSSYYTVEPDEEAVVIRLGKYINTSQPGLHFKIPLGIDKVIKVKTKIVHQAEFGFRTSSVSTRRTTYANESHDTESLMLTGDLNVAEVQWVVQYQISDPFKFIFKTSEPVTNVRDVSESIMRRVVGDKLVNDVLTTGRVVIADNAKALMQEILDKYDLGISIKSIKLQDVNPPRIVQPSFNEVNSAKQEQEKMINEAEQAYNKVIPEARGKADQIISEAEGYAMSIINRAHGDAERFNSIFTEYIKAPAITRKRIYLETMEQIFANLNQMTIVDPKIKGLIPIFNQNQIEQGK